MSICGVTDTPVLDFWWHLFWVSKPEWAALFKLCQGIHDIRSLRFISGATPLPMYIASIAASRLTHILHNIISLLTGILNYTVRDFPYPWWVTLHSPQWISCPVWMTCIFTVKMHYFDMVWSMNKLDHNNYRNRGLFLLFHIHLLCRNTNIRTASTPALSDLLPGRTPINCNHCKQDGPYSDSDRGRGRLDPDFW